MNAPSLKTPPRWVLSEMESPAKLLATAVILLFGLAMAGAIGQIIVHDILPMTVGETAPAPAPTAPTPISGADGPGDLFSDGTTESPVMGAHADAAEVTAMQTSLLDDEQFIWTLRWTHIHLFGMNMIFILMGPITLMLDKSARVRGWLVVLPFAGVVIDIAAMWLKNFISPVFFWLHVPGGLLFGGIFVYVSLTALWQMWGGRGPAAL